MSEILRMEHESLDSWIKNAQMLSDANLLPKEYRGNPANILLAIQTGAPLGFGAIESINGIHVINGKPTMSADLVQAAIRKAGHRLRVSGDDTYATAILVRADDPDFEFEVTWDMDRAKTAGLLGNPTWKKYPAAMLRSRAITEVARMGAADALHGVIYTPEELGHMENQPHEATQPRQEAPLAAPVAQAPSTDWKAAADAIGNTARLREVWAEAQAKGELAVEIEPGVTVKQYLADRGAALAEQEKQAEQADWPTVEVPADPDTGEVIEDAVLVEDVDS